MPALLHRPRCALCGSIKKYIHISLYRECNCFTRGGGRRLLTNLVLQSVCGPFAFFGFLIVGCFLVFLLTQKYWRETHLLDPLHQPMPPSASAAAHLLIVVLSSFSSVSSLLLCHQPCCLSAARCGANLGGSQSNAHNTTLGLSSHTFLHTTDLGRSVDRADGQSY